MKNSAFPLCDISQRSGLFSGVFLQIIFTLFFSQILSAQDTAVVKVGVLLSLSGGLEQWCSYIRQGVELAVAEEHPVTIDVKFEDDHSIDRRLTLTAARKLVSLDGVDLLASWTASTVPVLSSLVRSARIPFLVGAYDANVARQGPYVFGAFVNYELVPAEIAQFLVEKKKAKRLALIMAADDWSQSFDAPFSRQADKSGAQILIKETVSPDEKDLRALALRLKKEKIQAVLAPLYAGSLYSFLKLTRELNFPGLIHVGDGMFEEDLKVAGLSAEGVYASQIWLESGELSAVIKERFGAATNPLQLGLVATGYDWVKHLKAASLAIIQEGRTISRESLAATLKTFKSIGYSGEMMLGAAPVRSGEINMIVNSGRYVRVE